MARILLADDDAAQLAVQSSLLEALGHRIDIAFSPSEALRQLTLAAPDLIVLDLRFPTAADGLALIRAVRATGYLRPVIVLSGWPDDLYGAPEEPMVSRVVVKGSVRVLLETIAGLLGG
jgi:CheY-like chemotaxis protein